MENLKNIKNYNDFKDSLNEELLWDAIKNLFSKLFGKIDKKLSDSVAEFTKKLDNSKSWDESVKYYEMVVNAQSSNIDKSLNDITGPLGLRKLIADHISVNFIQLQEMFNKYQSPELSPKKIYEGTPEQDIFNYNKSEELKNNLLNICNAKIIELNKSVGNPYDEQKLKTYLDQNGNVDEVPNAQNYKPEEDTRRNVSTNAEDTTTFDSYKYNKMILEAEQNPPAGGEAPAGGAPSGGAPAADSPINKLKESVKKFINENLYQVALKKVKEVKSIKSVGNQDPYDAIAKTSKATNLYGSLSKLLRNIVNLDKGELIKLRDNLADIKRANKEDYKREMPL